MTCIEPTSEATRGPLVLGRLGRTLSACSHHVQRCHCHWHCHVLCCKAVALTCAPMGVVYEEYRWFSSWLQQKVVRLYRVLFKKSTRSKSLSLSRSRVCEEFTWSHVSHTVMPWQYYYRWWTVSYFSIGGNVGRRGLCRGRLFPCRRFTCGRQFDNLVDFGVVVKVC